MSTAYLEGWDFLPPAPPNNNFRFILTAMGIWGTTPAVGVYWPIGGAFGIGSCMRFTSPPGGINAFFPLDRTVSSSGFVWGFRCRVEPNVSNKIMYLHHSQSEESVFRIEFPGPDAAGILRFIGAFGTARTRTGLIIPDTWFYVQVKWVPGSFQVLVNGDVVIDLTSPGTPPIFDTWRITSGFSTSAQFMDLDDMYILHVDGIDNTDYLGNIRVGAQLPVAAGDVTMLTAFGGSFNWQIASNYFIQTSVYNYTPDVGDYDLYQMNPNVAARQVYAISARGFYFQDDGVQLKGQNVVKTGGIELYGLAQGLNQMNYGSIVDYWDRNPNTDDFWTTSELNEPIQAGPKLESSE